MNRKELLALYTHFQYPQPDRSLCNVDKCHIAAHLEEILSVSSAGSKPLQSPSLLPAQVSPRRKTFSILSRIEASAIDGTRAGEKGLLDLFTWQGRFLGLSARRFSGLLPFVVYTKLGCFASRFLRKSKAGFREE